MNVELGKRYRDPVSGWKGTAVSVTTYLYGCRRVALEGADEKGEPKTFMFDEPQLIAMGGKPTVVPTPEEKKTGGPRGTVEVPR